MERVVTDTQSKYVVNIGTDADINIGTVRLYFKKMVEIPHNKHPNL